MYMYIYIYIYSRVNNSKNLIEFYQLLRYINTNI